MNSLFLMPFGMIFFWLLREHVETIARPRVARLTLALVLLVPVAGFAQQPAKPAPPVLSDASLKMLQPMVIHQAKLRQQIDRLNAQMARALADWQEARTDALNAAGVDPKTHEIEIDDATGNLIIVDVKK
jgi:hypothetical protein